MKRVLLLLILVLMINLVKAQTKDSIYVFTTDNPSFPGGDSARIAFINSHLEKEGLFAENIFKNVLIQVVVEKSGTLKIVRVINKENTTLENEVLEIVKSMPLWIPAKVEENIVSSFMVLPFKMKFSAKAEMGTVYYNSKWEKTSEMGSVMSRTIVKKEGVYEVEYLDGDHLRIEAGEFSSINPSIRHGRYLCYYKDGSLKSEYNYVNDSLHGAAVDYYQNGKTREWCNYKKNLKDGNSYEYLDNGELVVEKKYVDDKMIKETHPFKVVVDKNDTYTHIVADTNLILPHFPDGKSAMTAFIDKNLKYPNAAKNKGIGGGESVIAFDIEVDGAITNIRVVKSLHPLLDEEAIRVVKIMPKWVPATKRGKPIKVKYTWYAGFREPKN